MVRNTTITGTVRGTTLQLDHPSGLPDGTRVKVQIDRAALPMIPAIERLRRAFGACADDPAEVDRFLEQVRKDRDSDAR